MSPAGEKEPQQCIKIQTQFRPNSQSKYCFNIYANDYVHLCVCYYMGHLVQQ